MDVHPLVRKIAASDTTNSATHYHIFWSNESLDWKPFPTKEEATILADQIKKPDEGFTVVERDGQCERCKIFKSASKNGAA
jgi:hypothetical protein